MRTCQCGGVIRENGKAYWDTLPSCSCQNPIAIPVAPIVWTTKTTLERKTKDE